ncbi:hypothetical protein J6590_024739 [Homalodisca vitripennis]|nr:hypothetical protein J6590_024739 [Homalodisca vitripennis]
MLMRRLGQCPSHMRPSNNVKLGYLFGLVQWVGCTIQNNLSLSAVIQYTSCWVRWISKSKVHGQLYDCRLNSSGLLLPVRVDTLATVTGGDDLETRHLRVGQFLSRHLLVI